MVIKRYRLILFVLPVLIFLSGCSNSTLRNVDTFIDNFNEISDKEISKPDIYGFEENGIISHCFTIDDTLISLNTNKDNMLIMSADAVTEKSPDENYKNAVRLMIKSLTTIPDHDIFNKTETLISSSNKFVRATDEMYEYTLSYISLDVGSKFTLSFNRLIPAETTNIPVTDQEFKEYSTIPDTKE